MDTKKKFQRSFFRSGGRYSREELRKFVFGKVNSRLVNGHCKLYNLIEKAADRRYGGPILLLLLRIQIQSWNSLF